MMNGRESVSVRAYKRYCEGFEYLCKAETIFANVITDIEGELNEEESEMG